VHSHQFRFALSISAVFLGSLVSAQTLTTGTIVGAITDSSGAVVRGAVVTLDATTTGDRLNTVSGDDGHYRFPLMKPGEYRLSARAPGLQSGITNIDLLVGQQQAVNLVLNVERAQQTVEVTASAGLVQTENANQATSYGAKQVADLPINGGDITNLAFSTPGLRLNVGGGNNNFNLNGLPFNSGLYTMNGADIIEPYNLNNKSGASNNTLGANDIAEAAVILNAYSAQYGRMAGGQINYITKSGGNSFHGNLAESYNDAILNANDFFNNATGTPRGRSVANQYAAGLGGPIRKNKTEFYVNTEGLRYALPSNGVISVPSPQLEQYTLSHIPAASVPLYQEAFSLYNNAPGINRAVPVTSGAGLLQDSTGNLGCGKQKFPGTFVSGSSGARFGVDVPCALAFGTNAASVNTESLTSGRVDHELTGKQRVYVRLSYDLGVQSTSTSPLNPVLNRVSNQPWILPQINHTYVITPALVNNFIASGNYYSAVFGAADFSKAFALMPAAFSFNDGGANGGGFFAAGANTSLPTGRRGQQLQLIDDLSWSHGHHTLQFGANYRDNKVTDTSIASGSQIGTYTFNDLSDFAVGIVNSTNTGSKFTQSFPLLGAAHIAFYSFDFYAQDEWNVQKGLKITYGMRFERNGNPNCKENCLSRLNSTFLGSGYQGGTSAPYNSTILSGLHTTFQTVEAIVAEPRLGVVFTPFGQGKTVFRAGAGLFANTFAGNVSANIFGNSPNKFSPTVGFGNVGLATDPNSSQASAVASAQVFENGFSQGYTLPQFQSALGKVPFATPTFFVYPPNFKNIKTVEWSFEVEHPLGASDVLSINYSGNHAYDEPISNLDANAYIGTPSRYPSGFGGLSTAIPDARFSTVTQVLSNGFSNYDGLTIQERHAFHHGFQGQVFYTWSHALQLDPPASGTTASVYNPYNLNFGYGATPFDTRHNLTGDIIWNSPKFDQKPVNWLLGGWTLGSKLYLYSGRPFSVTNSQIPGLLSTSFGGTVLADLLDPSILGIHCTDVNSRCFTPSQFTASTPTAANPHQQTDFGNIPPNSFRGPGFFNIAAQVTKKFPIAERVPFEIGASMFNVLNHPSFAVPNGNVTSGSFGLITSTVSSPTSIYGTGQGAIVSGRVVVVMAKLSF
jgi:carboxypeptidase family protein/TonB-dependent receptor-like protein